MVRFIILLMLSLSMLSGCDRYDFSGILFSPGDNVNRRFEQNAEHIGVPAAEISADDGYLFYVCTDPHISETADNLVRFMSDFRNNPGASFGICLGDCIDVRGKMREFASMTGYDPERDGYAYPLFVTLGNHDTYFSQWEDFRRYIGPSCGYFTVTCPSGTDLFISLDSANAMFGRKQLDWLAGFLGSERDSYRRVFVYTHTNFFKTGAGQLTSGSYTMEETMYVTELFDRYDVALVLQGHAHVRDDLTYRGVRYNVLGALEDSDENAGYLKVRVAPEGLELEWVAL